MRLGKPTMRFHVFPRSWQGYQDSCHWDTRKIAVCCVFYYMFTIVLTDCQLFIYFRHYASCTIDITQNCSERAPMFPSFESSSHRQIRSFLQCLFPFNQHVKIQPCPNHLESSLHLQTNVNLRRKKKQAYILASTYCDNIYDQKWKKMMEMTQNAEIIVL